MLNHFRKRHLLKLLPEKKTLKYDVRLINEN